MFLFTEDSVVRGPLAFLLSSLLPPSPPPPQANTTCMSPSLPLCLLSICAADNADSQNKTTLKNSVVPSNITSLEHVLLCKACHPIRVHVVTASILLNLTDLAKLLRAILSLRVHVGTVTAIANY
jgi:hypothetical protein